MNLFKKEELKDLSKETPKRKKNKLRKLKVQYKKEKKT